MIIDYSGSALVLALPFRGSLDLFVAMFLLYLSAFLWFVSVFPCFMPWSPLVRCFGQFWSHYRRNGTPRIACSAGFAAMARTAIRLLALGPFMSHPDLPAGRDGHGRF